MKILLSGGGTGGSVTPLLAMAEELALSDKDIKFLWVGTKNGLERKMIEDAEKELNLKIKFMSIPHGKLRRYLSIHNFIGPVFIIAAFFKSLWIIFSNRPDFILTAGSFVAVPVVWAGWLLRVPILVHQQDVKVGLANKLMAPFASIVTVSLKESIADFQNSSGSKKVYFTGNAVRRKILNASEKNNNFNMAKDIPVLLVLGGGTGAFAVNKIIVQIIPKLTKFCQIIHITGENKTHIAPLFCRDEAVPRLYDEGYENITSTNQEAKYANKNSHAHPQAIRYHAYPFLTNIEEAFAFSDLVISRCGMGVLSELAVLGKPAVLIPMPDSHQELNAKYFARHEAAIVLDQNKITPEQFLDIIKKLLYNKDSIIKISHNIKNLMPEDGAKKISEIVQMIIKKP